MSEPFEYISSSHFIDLIEAECPRAVCKDRQHGYTCFVEGETKQHSFAVIEEKAAETHVYYDTKSARGRTTIHGDEAGNFETDHVVNRITSPAEAPKLTDFLRQHEERLTNERAAAPEIKFLDSGDEKRVYDASFEDGTIEPEHKIRGAFRSEVEERSTKLHTDSINGGRHDKFGSMCGRRIEPLQKRNQPDIVLELLMLGSYELVKEVVVPSG